MDRRHSVLLHIITFYIITYRHSVYIQYVFVFPDAHLAVRRSVNPVMVDSPLVPQRNGPLAWAALTLTDQKAPVDARAEQVLCRVA